MRSYGKKDFELYWFSGTGAGGQYRNKHQNSCRIIHKETGLMAIGQRHRDREANLKDAFRRLAAKLLSLDDLPIERRHDFSVVRTYHFERNEAIDHATGKRASVGKVLDGLLDEFLLTPAREGKRPNSGRA